jgi:CubicO group peptidase (beta-lactamase class C family)
MRAMLAMLAGVTLVAGCGRDRPAAGTAGAGGGAPETRIDELFARFTAPGSPGCAVAVVRDGRVVFARGYGLADLDRRVPITPRTVFDIASTSKQFTAASVLLLAERGRLSLDDDVHRFLPELPPYPWPVTLGELLHNTSGLPDYIDLLERAGKRPADLTTDDDALAVLIAHPALLFQPGSAFRYSDSGFFLLSLVVKRVTGQSLRQFAAANLFVPMGMTDTQFLDDVSRAVPHRAVGYSPSPGGGFRPDQANWQQTGDGAVNTTVLDLARWDGNFTSGRVGGRRLIDDLLAPAMLDDGSRLAYGGGLVLDSYRRLERVRHAGSWTGYRAELMRLPERRLSVITLCNLSTADPTALCEQVADLYLDP